MLLLSSIFPKNYARIFKRNLENTRLLYVTGCYTKTNRHYMEIIIKETSVFLEVNMIKQLKNLLN